MATILTPGASATKNAAIETGQGVATLHRPSLSGGGASTFASLTDKASVDLPATNTPLANALAAKAPSTGILKAALDTAVQTSLTKADNAAVALTPVFITTNTILTRAAHYNRLIIVNAAGAVTLTATGTDALAGDFISVDVTGGGSVTLAGVTSQAGYTLSAVSGGTVEARCAVAASFIAATRVNSEAGAVISGSRSITASDLEKVLDVTATATVTIPVDATLGISAAWRGSFATNQTTSGAPTFTTTNAIQGTAATAGIGALQILRHVGADTWAYA